MSWLKAIPGKQWACFKILAGKEKTLLHARQTGKIHSGEAGLRSLRKALEKDLGMPVDVSVIREGGPFDSGPYVALK